LTQTGFNNWAPVPFERWYGFSIYLPGSWASDRSPEIVTQWHQESDIGGSPPLAMMTRNGNWEILQAWTGNSAGTATPIGRYETGRWTDWVVHVKWASDASGLLQIWKNGQLVPGFANKAGKTTYDVVPGNQYTYMKIGLYKWDWAQNKPSDTTSRLMFHDEVRIADGTNAYSVVAPPATWLGPSATLYRDGRLVVFARGSDGQIYHRWQTTPNGNWSGGWQSIGAPPGGALSDPDATLNQPGGLVVFARGADGAIWHCWQGQMNGNWSGWASLGSIATSGPGATLYRDGRRVVFVRGTDNTIWHRWQTTPNGNWSGWESIGAPPGGATSDPDATLNQPGGLVAFTRGADGAIWHCWQGQMNGNWSGWATLGATP
jgi:hypothetical protein